MIGGISGVILMSWISLNAQLAIASGHMQFPPKQLEVDQCSYTFTQMNSTISDAPTEEFHSLFKISYMWYVIKKNNFLTFSKCFLVSQVHNAWCSFHDRSIDSMFHILWIQRCQRCFTRTDNAIAAKENLWKFGNKPYQTIVTRNY